MNCACCGQRLPPTCLECGRIGHFLKSKKSITGMRYQVRECDLGHRFVVTPDGRTAKRYSGALENDHVATPEGKGLRRRSEISGQVWRIEA